MNRYRLANKTTGFVVEHYYPETLRHIRKTDARFKFARIRDILQLRPDLCKVGEVYQWGEPA